MYKINKKNVSHMKFNCNQNLNFLSSALKWWNVEKMRPLQACALNATTNIPRCTSRRNRSQTCSIWATIICATIIPFTTTSATILWHNDNCEMAAGGVCLPHPLHLRKVVQQADGVLGVGLVVLAARRSYPQRPRGHGLQHCFIKLLGDKRVGQFSQVVLQYSWKRQYTEREINSCGRTVSRCWIHLLLRGSLQHQAQAVFPHLNW